MRTTSATWESHSHPRHWWATEPNPHPLPGIRGCSSRQLGYHLHLRINRRSTRSSSWRSKEITCSRSSKGAPLCCSNFWWVIKSSTTLWSSCTWYCTYPAKRSSRRWWYRRARSRRCYWDPSDNAMMIVGGCWLVWGSRWTWFTEPHRGQTGRQSRCFGIVSPPRCGTVWSSVPPWTWSTRWSDWRRSRGTHRNSRCGSGCALCWGRTTSTSYSSWCAGSHWTPLVSCQSTTYDATRWVASSSSTTSPWCPHSNDPPSKSGSLWWTKDVRSIGWRWTHPCAPSRHSRWSPWHGPQPPTRGTTWRRWWIAWCNLYPPTHPERATWVAPRATTPRANPCTNLASHERWIVAPTRPTVCSSMTTNLSSTQPWSNLPGGL